MDELGLCARPPAESSSPRDSPPQLTPSQRTCPDARAGVSSPLSLAVCVPQARAPAEEGSGVAGFGAGSSVDHFSLGTAALTCFCCSPAHRSH